MHIYLIQASFVWLHHYFKLVTAKDVSIKQRRDSNTQHTYHWSDKLILLLSLPSSLSHLLLTRIIFRKSSRPSWQISSIPLLWCQKIQKMTPSENLDDKIALFILFLSYYKVKKLLFLNDHHAVMRSFIFCFH